MTDLSQLAGGPPSGDNVELNTLRGRIDSPPLSATDAMEVVVPSFSGALSYTVPASNWSPSFATLPQKDAPCVVVIDSDGDAWVPVWAGMNAGPLSTRLAAVEALAVGPAGGDLAGNYPNPTLKRARLNVHQTTGADYTTNTGAEGAIDTTNLSKTVTTHGYDVEVTLVGQIFASAADSAGFSLYVDGAFAARRMKALWVASRADTLNLKYVIPGLAAGAHVFQLRWFSNAGALITLNRNATFPLEYTIEERP